ncbi:MAG TPA: tetratricopeptide repeat protein [Candidatus Angelobacter sp.]|nr:tetratricopeptide repeat protein [Candidatus Angelobacter sp.]
MCPIRLFRFGLFEADLESCLLSRRGVRIRLQQQPFRILSMLLEKPGQIVTREELRAELWPAGTYVDFEGSLNAALTRLRAALEDPADNPRFIETVPKRGYRFIAPVTPASAVTAGPPADVVAESKHFDSDSGAPPQPPFPAAIPALGNPKISRTGLWLAVVGMAIALVAVAAGFVLRRERPRSGPSTASAVPVVHRRSVAVLGFHNASGKPADTWLSAALVEMLRTELGAGDRLRVVSGEEVEDFRRAAPWSETDSLSSETASRLRSALDADYLVLGSYVTLGRLKPASIRVDFRLQDAESGRILYQGAETGSEQQFFGLVARLGIALREHLGLPPATESEQIDALSSLPANPDAARFYALGLEKMRADDFVSARDLFLQAARIVPDFALVHLQLSRTWGDLGYDLKARAEAKKAFDLSPALPQADRLMIEAAYYQTRGDKERAAAAYRALYALYPDNLDQALQLVGMLNSASHREEAMAIVQQLRRLPPPTSDDARIDYWQANLISYSNGPAAAPFINRAAEKAAARGQKLLYARVRLGQCLGLIYSEAPQAAGAPCQEAYEIFMAAGNRLMAADALRIMGDRRGSEGDFEGAVEIYRRALEMLRPLGEHEKTGAVLNNMGIALENMGQFARAEKLFTEARRNFEECGDTLNATVSLSDIADVMLARGDLRRAERTYQAVLRIMEAVSPADSAYELCSIAQIRLFAGDLAQARRYAEQAIAKAEARGSPQDSSQGRATLADVLIAQGELAAARQNLQAALEVRQKMGGKNVVAQSRAAIAAVSLEENKAAEAEGPLRESIAEFHNDKDRMDEVRADIDLARVLLAQGKTAEAESVVTQAASLSRDSQDPGVILPLAIASSRVKMAEAAVGKNPTGEWNRQRARLQEVIAKAHTLGYYLIEAEARLALGEVELRATPAAGRSHLAVLERQSHQRGMELISRKAAGLIQPAVTAISGQQAALR